MPDLVRHDGQKLSAFLNYDTVCQARNDETATSEFCQLQHILPSRRDKQFATNF
jgi:hypothetical protein